MQKTNKKPPISALRMLQSITREQRAEIAQLLPAEDIPGLSEHWAWVARHKILIRSGLSVSALNRQVAELVDCKQVKVRGEQEGTTRGEVKLSKLLFGRVRK